MVLHVLQHIVLGHASAPRLVTEPVDSIANAGKIERAIERTKNLPHILDGSNL